MHAEKTDFPRLLAVVALAVLCFVLTFVQGAYMRNQTYVSRYLENSSPVFRIPDIDHGFIPQGISYYPDTDSILLTGYFGQGGSSPIYVIDRLSGQGRKILMRTPEGGSFQGHAGGLSLLNEMVYIAGSTENCMYGFSLAELMDTADSEGLNALERISLSSAEDKIRVSFTAADSAYLYAGEFHKAPLFRTNALHKVKTPVGAQNAYLAGFAADTPGGAVPTVVYSIPDNVQGACFDRGYLYLSQTSSLLSSRILTFSLAELRPVGTKAVLGREVPLILLTESAALKITRIPPMSEELMVVDEQMYILFESASDRYRIGKRLGLDFLMATPVSFFQ